MTQLLIPSTLSCDLVLDALKWSVESVGFLARPLKNGQKSEPRPIALLPMY